MATKGELNSFKLKLKRLEKKLDQVLSIISPDLEEKTFKINSFCQALGITPYILRKEWERLKLPIPKPQRAGHDPVYTLEDLRIARERIFGTRKFTSHIG